MSYYNFAVTQGFQDRGDYWRGERSKVAKLFEEFKKANPHATMAEMEDFFQRNAPQQGMPWLVQPKEGTLQNIAQRNLEAKTRADTDARLSQITKRLDLDRTLDETAKRMAIARGPDESAMEFQQRLMSAVPGLAATQVSRFNDQYFTNIDADVWSDKIDRLKKHADAYGYELDDETLTQLLGVPLQAKKRFQKMYKDWRGKAEKRANKKQFVELYEKLINYAKNSGSVDEYNQFIKDHYENFKPTAKQIESINKIWTEEKEKRDRTLRKENEQNTSKSLAAMRQYIGSEVFKTAALMGTSGAIDLRDNAAGTASLKELFKSVVIDGETVELFFPKDGETPESKARVRMLREEIKGFLTGANASQKDKRRNTILDEARTYAAKQNSDQGMQRAGLNRTESAQYKIVAKKLLPNGNSTDLGNLVIKLQQGLNMAVQGYKLNQGDLFAIMSGLDNTTVRSTGTAEEIANSIRNSSAFKKASNKKSASDAQNRYAAELKQMYSGDWTWKKLDDTIKKTTKENQDKLKENFNEIVNRQQTTPEQRLDALKALRLSIPSKWDAVKASHLSWKDNAESASTYLVRGQGSDSAWGGGDTNYTTNWMATNEQFYQNMVKEIEAAEANLAATVAAQPVTIPANLAQVFNLSSTTTPGPQGQPPSAGLVMTGINQNVTRGIGANAQVANKFAKAVQTLSGMKPAPGGGFIHSNHGQYGPAATRATRDINYILGANGLSLGILQAKPMIWNAIRDHFNTYAVTW